MSAVHVAALGPELNIASAAASRELLADALLAASGDVALDLSTVDDIDSAGVQLLLSMRNGLRARGAVLHLRGVTTHVRDALAVFGLDDALQPTGARP